MPQAVLVAPLRVKQAWQREKRRKALHLLPESSDGAKVLLIPCQFLLELLQGGLDTNVVLNLQSQFYPCVAETNESSGAMRHT